MSEAIRIPAFAARSRRCTWPGGQQLAHGQDLQLVQQLALAGGDALDRAVVLVAGCSIVQCRQRLGLTQR